MIFTLALAVGFGVFVSAFIYFGLWGRIALVAASLVAAALLLVPAQGRIDVSDPIPQALPPSILGNPEVLAEIQEVTARRGVVEDIAAIEVELDEMERATRSLVARAEDVSRSIQIVRRGNDQIIQFGAGNSAISVPPVIQFPGIAPTSPSPLPSDPQIIARLEQEQASLQGEIRHQAEEIEAAESQLLSAQEELERRVALNPFAAGQANTAHTIPSRMAYRYPTSVLLALAPEALEDDAVTVLSDLLATAPSADPASAIPAPISPDIPFALDMRATLTGGADFEITSIGAIEQAVVIDRPTIWAWTVTPTNPGGNRPLSLSLISISKVSGSDPRDRNLSPHTILVTIEAGFLDRMLFRIAQIEPLQASIGAAIALLLSLLTFYFKFLRKPSEEAPDAA